jgi:uncharacterized protein YbaP (TraB family)
MTRLLATLFTLLVTCAAAWAEAPLCRGTDLLAALKISDPATYDTVMAEARAVPNGQSLFWKIEREGLPPSYLLGTAHVTDPRVNALPPETRTALWGAATVALELKELRSHQEVAMAGMRNARLMVMPPGQSLWDLIPDEDEAAIRGNVNLPPGTHGSLFGYQPWVVAGMLSIPLCEMERKAKGEIILDSRIAQIAGEMNTPLIGLETVEEQLSVFSAMPLDVQARYLVAVARLGPRIGDYFETLVALYEQRNVVAYMPLVLHTEEVSDDDMKIYAFVEEDLLRKRNHRMAERSANLLAQGNVFIAVGALHLPGAEGLVELIRKAGYKVTPLN